MSNGTYSLGHAVLSSIGRPFRGNFAHSVSFSCSRLGKLAILPYAEVSGLLN
jgi:hypothetical protein